MHHVRRFLYQSGGVRLDPQQRSERHLTGDEREEISRDTAAGEFAWQLARRLGRSASTVSREIARNGGRDRYRAASADAAAYARGRRPKQAKLAQRPALRALVEAKLALCWSPQQITGWLRRQFPRRHLHADLARGDLPLALRPAPPPGDRPQPHPAAADRGAHAPPEGRPPAHRAGRDPRHGVHQRPPRRGRGSQDPRPLGRRTRDGHPALSGCHPRRAHQPVHRHRRAAGRHQGRAGRAAPHPKPSRHPAPAAAHPYLGPGPRDGRTPGHHRKARGSAAPTRTPTGCCGSTSPRARTSAHSARPTWTPSPTSSTTVRARSMATALRQTSNLTS